MDSTYKVQQEISSCPILKSGTLAWWSFSKMAAIRKTDFLKPAVINLIKAARGIDVNFSVFVTSIIYSVVVVM